MKMNDYIAAFTDHLTEALQIGRSTQLTTCHKEFRNILICGLGGSGIGGTIVADLVASEVNIPICATKDYSIPNFVNEHTLVIASSYSGNTEETLFALEKCQARGAEIACVTSGGKLKALAEEKNYNLILIPGEQPPRAMFAYSFTQLFFFLNHYGLIDNSFENIFEKSITLLNDRQDHIRSEAKKLADKMYGNTPVIYTANGFEGVGVRFRQQINENSKMLCWHHVIPEMNHNELLGWRTNTENLAVVYLRNKGDYYRNQVRMDINKKVIAKFTDNISEIWSEGESPLENTLYHIHLGDWVSWYLSVKNNVDAIEIDVINFLKGELAKV
ncbi:MAG: bifunctional phosphoglucose/phosphomannose isomerase [Bacteroidetes bacterium]|nr:bifunctional phosphoglucose/phosphomannose isomerase [Bacteroidota bacterium]